MHTNDATIAGTRLKHNQGLVYDLHTGI
jgi:hypothetical protein